MITNDDKKSKKKKKKKKKKAILGNGKYDPDYGDFEDDRRRGKVKVIVK